jgi:hypothetical protein
VRRSRSAVDGVEANQADLVHAEDLVDDGALRAPLLVLVGLASRLVLGGEPLLAPLGLLLLLAILLGELGLGEGRAVAGDQPAVDLAGLRRRIDLVDLGLGLLDAAVRVQPRLLEDLRERVLVEQRLVALEVLADLLQELARARDDGARIAPRSGEAERAARPRP